MVLGTCITHAANELFSKSGVFRSEISWEPNDAEGCKKLEHMWLLGQNFHNPVRDNGAVFSIWESV